MHDNLEELDGKTCIHGDTYEEWETICKVIEPFEIFLYSKYSYVFGRL